MIFLIKNLWNQYSSIVKNLFFFSIADGIKLLLPFIAMPYIIKTCGVESCGKIIYCQAIMSYFSKFVNFGLSIVTVRKVAQNAESKKKLSHIISSFMILRLILISLSFAFLLTMILLIPFLHQFRNILLYCFTSVLAEAFIMTAFFQCMEKMQNIAALQLFSIVFYVSTLFIVVREQAVYKHIPKLQSIGILLSALSGTLLMRIKYGIQIRMVAINDLWILFKRSVPFAMSHFARLINGSVARIFTGAVLDMHELAVLDVAQKIFCATTMPINIIDQAVYPYNTKNQNKFAARIFYCVLVAGGICALIMFSGISYAVHYFGRGELNDAIVLTRLLCIRVVVSALNHYVGLPVLVAFGYPKLFNMSIIYSALLILVIYPLLYYTGYLSLYTTIFIITMDTILIFSYRIYHCLKYKLLFISEMEKV